jgi:CheY-like chemotaxis protein
MMPVMDGWTFLQERDRDPDIRSIPVIVFSGQHNVERQVLAAHATYLKKPFSPERLKDALLQAMAGPPTDTAVEPKIPELSDEPGAWP